MFDGRWRGAVDRTTSPVGERLHRMGVTADTLTPVLTEPAIDSLAFDQNGNLYYTDDTDGTVDVLPAATGSIFGHSVSADTPTTPSIRILYFMKAPQSLALVGEPASGVFRYGNTVK